MAKVSSCSTRLLIERRELVTTLTFLLDRLHKLSPKSFNFQTAIDWRDVVFALETRIESLAVPFIFRVIFKFSELYQIDKSKRNC